MAKTSTKLAVYTLVQLLLFQWSGLVAAVHYYFRVRSDSCVGPAYFYENLPPYKCAPTWGPAAGSVEVDATLDTFTGFYGLGACCYLKFTHRGRGCAIGAGYTGAGWIPYVEPDEAPYLGPDEAREPCTSQTKATGIAYSEETMEGRWILTTDNATEMYTQMDTIPDAQKVDWLQAHGATFKPGL